MAPITSSLDPIDMGILYLLQEDARRNTNESIGEQLDIAGSTVGTRIRKLENEGIIESYNPIINYERAGFDHHFVVTCSVPFEECDHYIEVIVEEVTGVVNIRKFYTANDNLLVEIVARTSKEFEKAIQELKELDISIEDFEVVDRDVSQPFGQFGQEVIE